MAAASLDLNCSTVGVSKTGSFPLFSKLYSFYSIFSYIYFFILLDQCPKLMVYVDSKVIAAASLDLNCSTVGVSKTGPFSLFSTLYSLYSIFLCLFLYPYRQCPTLMVYADSKVMAAASLDI